jgi:hypothetical protein
MHSHSTAAQQRELCGSRWANRAAIPIVVTGREGIPNRGLLPIRAFIRSLLYDPGLTHRTKIEQRIGLGTPEEGHSESNANDPYKARDDDPNGHG